MAQVKATSIALYLVRVFDVLLAVLDYQRPSADQVQLRRPFRPICSADDRQSFASYLRGL